MKQEDYKIYQRVNKFEVSSSVTEWLKNSTEIIFDIGLQAIQNNRFEILNSCLLNISKVTNDYIRARKDYSIEQDRFITYVYERLVDMKNLVHKNSHPKIMLSIIQAARDISIQTFQIRPTRNFAGENYMPLGFLEILSDSCMSQEILKDTSYAPMTSIDYLVEIAKRAVDNNFPRTATLITDRLGRIAVFTTKLHLHYGDIIAGKANWGLLAILDYLLSNRHSLSIDVEHELKSIIEQLNNSISTYIDDDIKFHYTFRNNLKTIFGPFADFNIASVFIKAIQNDSNSQSNYQALKILEEFLMNLNQNVMKAMNNSKYIDVREMLENIYPIGIVLINMHNLQKDPHVRHQIKSMFKIRFLYPFKNAISMSFKTDPNRYVIFDDAYMHAFFSLLGVLFYENKNSEFDDIIDSWSLSTLEIIKKNKEKMIIVHEGKSYVRHEISNLLMDLYKYARLVGIWFNKYLPKNKTLPIILSELKAQPEETMPRDSYSSSSFYPRDFIAMKFIVLRPHLRFDSRYFSTLDHELFNEEMIRNFEKKINK